MASMRTRGRQFRSASRLLILEGRVDLTTLTAPDADVELTVSFPGEVTSTNGTVSPATPSSGLSNPAS